MCVLCVLNVSAFVPETLSAHDASADTLRATTTSQGTRALLMLTRQCSEEVSVKDTWPVQSHLPALLSAVIVETVHLASRRWARLEAARSGLTGG